MGKPDDNIDNTQCPLGDACPIFAEVNQLQQDVNELKAQVRTDHLTQLFNLRHFNFTLEQEMERSRRSRQPTTLIMLDIDHFKGFNDKYGHVVGDKVLIHLAKVLQSAIRKIDIACRYGGEEFAIILPSTPLFIGVQVAERVRKLVEDRPLALEQESLSITVSLGIETFKAVEEERPKAFVDRADKQLYLAKENGRNRIHYAPETIAKKSAVSDQEKDALFNTLNENDKTQKE